MKKFWIILSLISIYSLQIQAQDTITYKIPRLRLGIEAGVNYFFGTINKPNMIRESRSYYYTSGNQSSADNDYYGGFISQSSSFAAYSFGLKLEYVLHKRVAISSGLRFSFYKATLFSDRNYFLWKISETETSSNYIKIKNLSQKNYYLAIPLEVRFFFTERDFFARFYLIAGNSFNFLIASSDHVEFQNPKMEKYNSTVKQHIGRTNLFYGSFYLGIGLKLGKVNYPFGNIEFFCPIVNLAKHRANAFVYLDAIPAMGIRTTLNIPMVRKHQLTYTVID